MIDQKKIEEAVRLFLEGIGEDVSREGLKETPGRIARMCEELSTEEWKRMRLCIFQKHFLWTAARW